MMVIEVKSEAGLAVSSFAKLDAFANAKAQFSSSLKRTRVQMVAMTTFLVCSLMERLGTLLASIPSGAPVNSTELSGQALSSTPRRTVAHW